MTTELRAVTLRHPWPWMVCHGKDIENRDWAPPGEAIGKPLAIHAGAIPAFVTPKGKRSAAGEAWVREFQDALRWILGRGIALPETPPSAEILSTASSIVAVVTLAGWINTEDESAGLSAAERDAAYASPWFVGTFGWVLRDLVTLPEPVPCRGAQGLWTVRDPVLSAVREGYRRARNGGKP